MKYDESNPKHVLARALAAGRLDDERWFRRLGMGRLMGYAADAIVVGREARDGLHETRLAMLCAKANCAAHPMLPSAWCVFHEPYDEAARAAGRYRLPGAVGERAAKGRGPALSGDLTAKGECE